MRKFLTALVAAASIAAATIAISSPAAAWHGGHGGYGWHGGYGYGPGAGFLAGAVIGGALAAPYYGGYPYGYYPYGGYPYGRGCVWRRVWNGYGWVRACV
jgi:hypothetical protein